MMPPTSCGSPVQAMLDHAATPAMRPICFRRRALPLSLSHEFACCFMHGFFPPCQPCLPAAAVDGARNEICLPQCRRAAAALKEF